jgi:DNA polymerase iota
MSSSSSESSLKEDWQEEQDERIVVHMDVDYFYCQCEEIEGQDRNRPIAIGQKHIIVTCNYVARHQGVKKLQLKTEAIRACPTLLILDGSDLERYRRHSRSIYTCFRDHVKLLAHEYGVDKELLAIRKGGMDEVYCDMTALVEAASYRKLPIPTNAFIYGESSAPVVITEDQSGAQSILHHTSVRSSLDDAEMAHNLHVAAACAERIRSSLHSTTGFTTCMGVSVSPMLAKIASDLKKPDSLSILYPWRSPQLISSMPLRKIPQLGSKTLQALKPCLERYHNRQAEFWTCSDLLRVPRHEVLACLQTRNDHTR